MTGTEHERWMDQALREARRAYEEEEVPVGAVVVFAGRIVGRGRNQVERLQDPTAHAEMIAITAAVSTLETKWLDRCRLYVTLEPCSMCAGAIVLARIAHLIIGTPDPKTGACGSVFDITGSASLNHRVQPVMRVREAQCGNLLRDFFKERRENPGDS